MATVTDLETSVVKEPVESKKGISNIMIISIIGGVVVVILVLVIVLLISGKKKKSKVSTNNYVPSIQTGPTPIPSPIQSPKLGVGNKDCPNCGKVVPKDSKFCGGCGYAFPAEPIAPDNCPNCNKPLHPGDTFCSGCGTKIAYISE